MPALGTHRSFSAFYVSICVRQHVTSSALENDPASNWENVLAFRVISSVGAKFPIRTMAN